MTDETTPTSEALTGEIVPVFHADITPDFERALAKAGVTLGMINIPEVPVYMQMTLDDLCVLPSKIKDCVGETPFMIVVSMDVQPEADEFEGYIGFFRAECVTLDREMVSFSHYLVSKETGELGPLARWCRACTPPFPVKIAKIKTRKAGRHVYRPLPVTLAAREPQ